MKCKIGKVLMVLGTCCLAAALVLVICNRQEARQSARASRELLTLLDAKIGQKQQPEAVIRPEPDAQTDPTLPEIPTVPQRLPLESVEIDGKAYIGKLQIPALGLELPILSDWSYENLRLAPCRYTGDPATEDLVLMAHNYWTHFGQIATLPQGAAVYLSDVNQNLTAYEVVSIEVLQPTQTEDMTSGSYPLTLFTCTFGGQSRIAVRCQEKCD